MSKFFVFEALPSQKGAYNLVLCLRSLKLLKASRIISRVPILLESDTISNQLIRLGSTLTVVECQALRKSAAQVLDVFEKS